MNLKGKWSLITGGAQRLGASMALSLAERGSNILLHYNNSHEQALVHQREIEKLNVSCHLVQADLTDDSQRQILLDDLHLTKLDILVNSASIFPTSSIWDWQGEDLQESMSIHLIASRDLSALFKDRTEEGVIINLLDCRIGDYDKEHVAYHFSKKALQQLTSMLAVELAPHVRVNAIAPGAILPPPGKGDAYLESSKKDNLLNRIGQPEDISKTLLFLIDSPFVTGQVIYVDGGRKLKGCFYG